MTSPGMFETIKEIGGLVLFLIVIAVAAFMLIVSMVVIAQEVPFGVVVSLGIAASVIFLVIQIIKKYVTAL